ncbi:MAG: hypothetical protein QF685_05815 [Verrucomicrobiota bacterium]|jgi:hypothetical protein|nr:hypothetical protein [Verrucomicrobiota bacterium]
MKELLKLLPLLGLVSLINLSIGCGETANVGDDTPPPAEDGYDGGGGDNEVKGDVENLKSPEFKGEEGAPKE